MTTDTMERKTGARYPDETALVRAAEIERGEMVARFLHILVTRIGKGLQRLADRRRERAVRSEVRHLNDYLLADIGLERDAFGERLSRRANEDVAGRRGRSVA